MPLCGSRDTSSPDSTNVSVNPHEVAGQCCFRCLFVWVTVAIVAIILLRR